MKWTIVCGALGLAVPIAAGQGFAGGGCCTAAAAAPEAPAPPASTKAPPSLPRLVDLGRTFCIPCKKMAPILTGLKRECAGRLDVEFIDVGKDPDAARTYGIRLIPTQIFLDASGRELARHEGFMSREEILAQWKKLGVDLGGGAPAP